MYTTTLGYDANGNRSLLGYPSGLTVNYTFDYADRPLTAASAARTFVSAANYLPFGPLSGTTMPGSGVNFFSSFSYDARYLPTSTLFDLVLADVPCSGTGTLARNPEIKWRLTPADFTDLQARQCAILRAALAQVAPGGRLIYSTCSLEKEENENLKHSAAIRYLAKKTGMTVHQVHLVAVSVNFLLVAFLIYWFARKSVPTALRNRTESIQRALEEGRAASQDANRRLAEIEARLSKLDTEIAQMQAQSEKEAAAEEGRIKQAAEDDIRKVVQAAEQEIASAAKQARRELSSHTADLAVALARKQIQVDVATDQALVRNFAGKLSSGSGGSGSGPSGKDRQ